MPYVNKAIERKIDEIHEIVCARDEHDSPLIYRSLNSDIIASLDDIAKTQALIVSVLERMLQRLENK